MKRNFRHTALHCFNEGVQAADPGKCLRLAVKKEPIPEPIGGKYIIISLGKAAISLMQSTLEILPKKIPKIKLAVTNYENFIEISDFEIVAAGHPNPDKNGLKAGKKVIKIIQSANKQDVVVILLSGGASALLPAPLPGLTLKDKIEINKLLLSADLNIKEINLVRQSMSSIKGGGLLSLIKSRNNVAYILSDVIGDDFRVIGSGPTSSRIGGKKEARALLIKKYLYKSLSKKQKIFFDDEVEINSQKLITSTCVFKNVLIGNNQKSVHAMAKMAEADIFHQSITENVEVASKKILSEVLKQKHKNIIKIALGGETTVNVTGKGLGGRNQELALRFAYEVYQYGLNGKWCFLSGGTDGKDGITEATGAIVNHNTIPALIDNGVCIETCLQQNDSHTALSLTKDVFSVGATGTNVADLMLFLGAFE